jgi:hypothetical protein
MGCLGAIMAAFLVLVTVGAIGSLVGQMSSRTNSSTDQSQTQSKGFKDNVHKVLGPLPAGWNEIRFEEIKSDNIRLVLVYRNTPSNLTQVENDTRRIARAALKALINNGRSPQQEMISLFVHAQMPERGETGASLVRYFGKTMYDYNDDQLTFKPAKN